MADEIEETQRIPARRGRRRLAVDHLRLKPAAPALGQTLQDAIYAQLRDALMVGTFGPGEALSVRSLAQSFGTSSMPVKDAMRRLVAEGVLQVQPQSSFIVEKLNAQRYLDLIEARVRLEMLLAARAAEIAPKAVVRTLMGLNERYRRAELSELPRANFDFHFMIYEAAQMPDVRDIVILAWLRTGALFSLIKGELNPEEDYVKHGKIIAAIDKRDPEQAALQVEADIRTTARRVAPLIA